MPGVRVTLADDLKSESNRKSNQPAPVEALLRELIDEVRGLRADMAAVRLKPDASIVSGQKHLSSVLAASVEDKAFSAREVMERAALLDVALRDALAAAGLCNPRQLGKWLRSVEGRELAGVRLERIGADHDGIVWRVWRV